MLARISLCWSGNRCGEERTELIISIQLLPKITDAAGEAIRMLLRSGRLSM